jgi:hypothetical protein
MCDGPCRYDRLMRVNPRRRLAATGLVLGVLATAVTGCGSSPSTGTSADPAGVVPANTPVYVSAVVRPQGSLQTNALSAGHKLTSQADPYKRLVSLVQTPGSPKLEYDRDVAPWLGPNAGVFFASLGSSSSVEGLLRQALTAGSTAGAGASEWPFGTGGATGAQGAIVLDTSDLAKAQAFVANAASHAGAHPTSYKGVSYQATAGGNAFAVVDRLVVLGTEAGVRAVIDTSQNANGSLKSDPTYSQLLSVAPSEALGHVYANPHAPAVAHAKANGSGLPGILTVLAGTRPLNVSLVPSSSSIALDADIGPAPAGTAATSSGLVGAVATGSQAFGELPGESWLAAGLGNAGGASAGELEGLQGLLSLVGTLGGAPPAKETGLQLDISVKGLIEGLSGPLKVLGADTPQARHDFQSWMGDTGIFASGTSVLELKAGVVISSKNPQASRAAVAKLAAGLNQGGAEATPTTLPGTEAAVEAKVNGLPVTLVIADGRDSLGQSKFVIGISSTSVLDALNPSSTLSSTPTFTAARSALGEGIPPSISLNAASLVSLLEGIGLSEDTSVSQILPYLRASTTLSGGGKSLGSGIERLRLVLGLQPASH